MIRLPDTYYEVAKKDIKRLLHWLMPPNCLLCEQSTADSTHLFCSQCDLEAHLRTSYCQFCGQSFASGLDYCGRCLSQPAQYDSCFCPFDFSGAMQQLIWRFKYQQQAYLAKPLAHILCAQIDQSTILLPEAVVGVPSHSKTVRRRGYNQSYLLAHHISKILGIPHIHGSLHKIKQTKRQANLNLKQRQTNLRGSFKIVKPLQVQSLVIVDDVITSGATMNEISKIIKKNGVDYVQAWGLAHTR